MPTGGWPMGVGPSAERGEMGRERVGEHGGGQRSDSAQGDSHDGKVTRAVRSRELGG